MERIHLLQREKSLNWRVAMLLAAFLLLPVQLVSAQDSAPNVAPSSVIKLEPRKPAPEKLATTQQVPATSASPVNTGAPSATPIIQSTGTAPTIPQTSTTTENSPSASNQIAMPSAIIKEDESVNFERLKDRLQATPDAMVINKNHAFALDQLILLNSAQRMQ